MSVEDIDRALLGECCAWMIAHSRVGMHMWADESMARINNLLDQRLVLTDQIRGWVPSWKQ